jgi:hypothetical protein
MSSEDGGTLLSELADFIGGYVAFPSPESRDTVALWVIHTHAIDAADSTPRLSLRSQEKQSGKSRLLEVLEQLVQAPMFTLHTSTSALFRRVDTEPTTLLFDEIDAIFTESGPENVDLRALLNGGYRRTARVQRSVIEGKKIESRSFAVFCPVALAGIGNLPDTLSDRSLVIVMRRRKPQEAVAKFRYRVVRPLAEAMRDKVAQWAADHIDALEGAIPAMPDGLSDRAEDCWEPLLAISDEAGADWPKRARDAAVELYSVQQGRDTSQGVRLLADLRAIFDDPKRGEPDSLPSAVLIEALIAQEESPWGDLRGRPLDSRSLARRLKGYEVRPVNIRTGSPVLKGYKREHLEDAWARYLPPTEQPDPDPGAAPEPPYTAPPTAATSATNGVSDLKSVADRTELDRPELDAADPKCSGVADVAAPGGMAQAHPEPPADPGLWDSIGADPEPDDSETVPEKSVGDIGLLNSPSHTPAPPQPMPEADDPAAHAAKSRQPLREQARDQDGSLRFWSDGSPWLEPTPPAVTVPLHPRSYDRGDA